MFITGEPVLSAQTLFAGSSQTIRLHVVTSQADYAGNLDNLRDIGPGATTHLCEATSAIGRARRSDSGADIVVNFAAESHVDRSIEHAAILLDKRAWHADVLDAARAAGVSRFVQISTDEVMGRVTKAALHRSFGPRTEQPVRRFETPPPKI